MKYTPIDSKLFVENRKKFVAELQNDSIAIFHSNDEMPRNGDCNFPFRQNSDLFWLSGIDQEQSILVIAPSEIFRGSIVDTGIPYARRSL